MFKRIKQRAETGLLVSALVVPIGLLVFGFIGLACYLTFRDFLPPNLAALVTAACGVVVIALVLIFAKIVNLSQRKKPADLSIHQDSRAAREEFEAYLRDQADPVLIDWVRRNPDKAALASLALGIAAGYSSTFRTVMLDAYARFARNESKTKSAP